MPDNGTAVLSRWGAVAGVAAGAAVVAAYLAAGERMVWAVAAVEVLLLMAYVGRRFRPRTPRGLYPVPTYLGSDQGGHAPDSAHCERCRRAREALDGKRAA